MRYRGRRVPASRDIDRQGPVSETRTQPRDLETMRRREMERGWLASVPDNYNSLPLSSSIDKPAARRGGLPKDGSRGGCANFRGSGSAGVRRHRRMEDERTFQGETCRSLSVAQTSSGSHKIDTGVGRKRRATARMRFLPWQATKSPRKTVGVSERGASGVRSRAAA